MLPLAAVGGAIDYLRLTPENGTYLRLPHPPPTQHEATEESPLRLVIKTLRCSSSLLIDSGREVRKDFIFRGMNTGSLTMLQS